MNKTVHLYLDVGTILAFGLSGIGGKSSRRPRLIGLATDGGSAGKYFLSGFSVGLIIDWPICKNKNYMVTVVVFTLIMIRLKLSSVGYPIFHEVTVSNTADGSTWLRCTNHPTVTRLLHATLEYVEADKVYEMDKIKYLTTLPTKMGQLLYSDSRRTPTYSAIMRLWWLTSCIITLRKPYIISLQALWITLSKTYHLALDKWNHNTVI